MLFLGPQPRASTHLASAAAADSRYNAENTSNGTTPPNCTSHVQKQHALSGVLLWRVALSGAVIRHPPSLPLILLLRGARSSRVRAALKWIKI